MAYVRAATLDEIAGYGNNSGFNSKIDRREFLKLAGEIGYAAALAACRGNNPNPISSDPQPNPNPQPGNAVEFENNIVSLLPSNIPINGTIYIPRGNENLELSIANNKVRVTRDKNLLPGIYSGSRITASGYHERMLDLIVKEDGFSTDLKDGRYETPINIIPSSINLEDFVSWCLRSNRLHRTKGMLTIEILDDGIYAHRGSGFIERVADYKPVQSTIDALMDVLKKDPSIYTAGLYPNEQGQVPSYVRIKSRGDDVKNDKFTNDGRILIYPDANLPPGWAIGRSDSANGVTTDWVTWGEMGFRPDITIFRSQWSTDLRECFGYWQRTREGFDNRGNPLPFFNNYAVIRENRPPGPFSG